MPSKLTTPDPGRAVRVALARLAEIDELIARQVREVTRSKEFRRRERAWRSLKLLYDVVCESDMLGMQPGVELLICDLPASELVADLTEASAWAKTRHGDVESSSLFELCWRRMLGSFDAPAIGLLVLGFAIGDAEPGLDDGDAVLGSDGETQAFLLELGRVAERCLMPCVIGLSSRVLGRSAPKRLTDGDPDLVWKREFQWLGELRRAPSARFLSFVLPQLFLRQHDDPWVPRLPELQSREGSPFVPELATLWAGGQIGVAAALARSFLRTGWFCDMRGVRPSQASGSGPWSVVGGGVVPAPRPPAFEADSPDRAVRPAVSEIISEDVEEGLRLLGISSILGVPGYPVAETRVLQTFQRARSDVPGESVDRAASQLVHLLSVCRIGHWLARRGQEVLQQYMSEELIGHLRVRLSDLVSAAVLPTGESVKPFDSVDLRADIDGSGAMVLLVRVKPAAQYHELRGELEISVPLLSGGT
ncbi:MAG: type VI secretion system contractile sheath large subunit [Phycisphaerales bacterium]